MRHDYHTHSTYSDGEFLWSMLSAAEDAGLDGVGVTDHCNVSARDRPQQVKRAMGFNLDAVYSRRRDAIENLRERFNLRVFDAVEMDYDPRDETEIERFLTEAGFDYTVGSVHTLDGVNVHFEGYFTDKSDMKRRELVDDYFDKLVSLVNSELFDVAAHLDLVERNPVLRGVATNEHHERVAEALEDSRTVPEINAGRVLDEYGEMHPTDDFISVLVNHDIKFVLGSDSHKPAAVEARKRELETFVDAHGVSTTELDL